MRWPTAWSPLFGAAGAYAIAGGVLLLPPLFWAVGRLAVPPRQAAAAARVGHLIAALVAAVAKETPWIAVVGAGLAGVAELFLNRNKTRK